MVRIAYLGTDGCPGHHVIPIRGKFTEEDIMGMYKIQLYIENILGSIQNKKPVDVGEVSDGYHTFNELYRYRMLYNAAFFNLLARNGQVEVCKSRRHSDGEKCFGSDDWFIVMAILPTGQVSNHYESKYWDLFDVPERETAFEYDGHTPNEAADRLKKYLKLPRRGMTFEQAFFNKRGSV